VAPYPHQAPPPSPKPEGNLLIWLLASIGLGAVLCVGAGAAWVYRAAAAANAPASDASAHGPTPPQVKLPPAQRHVPHHALSLLDGCTDDDVRALAGGIDGAIDVGAPLYNAGNFAGCYHMYEGTAADLERRLGQSCAGPVQALEAGRTRAASLTGASAQAWAMRDAFDGLIDVIHRRGGE